MQFVELVPVASSVPHCRPHPRPTRPRLVACRILHGVPCTMSHVPCATPRNAVRSLQMLVLVVSVAMGLAVHVAVGVGVNNISPRRGYPVFW